MSSSTVLLGGLAVRRRLGATGCPKALERTQQLRHSHTLFHGVCTVAGITLCSVVTVDVSWSVWVMLGLMSLMGPCFLGLIIHAIHQSTCSCIYVSKRVRFINFIATSG